MRLKSLIISHYFKRYKFIIFLLLFSQVSLAAPALSNSALYMRVVDNSDDYPHTKAICTAAIAKSEDHYFVLTAKHCTDTDSSFINFNFKFNTFVDHLGDPGEVFSHQFNLKPKDFLVDPVFSRDLSIAKISKENIPTGFTPFEVRQSNLVKGEILKIEGFGGGYGPTRLKCQYVGLSARPINNSNDSYAQQSIDVRVNGSMRCKVDETFYHADYAHIKYTGFSGAAVYDENDKIVGICWASLIENQDMGKKGASVALVFSPIVGNKFRDLSDIFCSSQQMPFCSKNYAVLFPTEQLVVLDQPVLLDEDFNYLVNANKLDENLKSKVDAFRVSLCARSGLSSYTLMQSENEISLYHVISVTQSDELKYLLNFHASEMLLVKKYPVSQKETALAEFQQKCKNQSAL